MPNIRIKIENRGIKDEYKKKELQCRLQSQVTFGSFRGIEDNEIASKYGVLPVSLKNWKKQFFENMSLVFG